MKLGILGAGAIGGVIGGYLARAGQDVTLIDTWPANIDQIKAYGLTVTAVEEEFTANPTALHLGEVSAARPAFDAVFLSFKSSDTSWAARFIEPFIAPGGFIVSAQNSINEDAIAAEVGWPRVMGCVVTIGAAMHEPGHARRTSSASRRAFAVGEPSGMITPRLEKMAGLLSKVGLARTTTNLWGERWAKLATNCMANAPAAITGLTSVELRQDPETSRLSIRLVSEVVNVASALGVSVEPINSIEAHVYAEAVKDGAKMETVRGTLIEQGKSLGEGRPSLAQDLMKGRKTEVEHLNGYVIRKAREVGVPTPANEAVYRLTGRLEAGELEPSIENLQHLDYPTSEG